MISDYILFNLEGSPNFQNSFNKRDQILKFNVLDLYDFLNQYGISKFIISLANNHILDNGIENFNKFIKFLNNKGIKFVGDKNNPFIEVGNYLIYSFVSWETGIKSNYFNYLNSLRFKHRKIQRVIDNNRKKKIIIYPHWGMDLFQKTTKNHFNFIKKNINKDNLYIYGHHPHLIIKENEKNNYIFSLGNTFIPHPNYYQRFGDPVRYSLAILLNSDKDSYPTLFNIFYDDKQLEIIEKVSEDDFILKNIKRKIPRPKGVAVYDFALKIFLNLIDSITSSKLYKYFRRKAFGKVEKE